MALPPGRIAAIHEVRRRRSETRNVRPRPSPDRHASPDRRTVSSREERKHKSLQKLFQRYDVNKSGKLEEDQVRMLLTDLDNTTPPGTPPTDEELQFVLKVAAPEGDHCLRFEEIEFAMRSWHIYTGRRREMEDKILEFDKSGTGTLSWQELKALLVALNDGNPVENVEVDWVMGEADIFGDGTIHKTELVMACAAWYQHVEQRQTSRSCAIL
mmetsp:Transcript_47075/g.108782  ORF Transcript_47075/g.108782 Transcript_47075/m.108782 type:complete len:213 (+) Transcript_47075:84-722(+)